jgi:hypothetical protein
MKTYMVDIDETICYTPTVEGRRDYKNSVPYPSRIAAINKLYDDGNIIQYWTARGSSSGIDWTDFTQKQLTQWGCKFHSCRCGKPSYDIWVDDKAINDKDFFDGSD